MTNPIVIPDEEKAQWMAEKRTARQREQAGMFADFVEPVTAEQIQEAARRHRDRFQATLDRLQDRGEGFRERVRLLVSAEEFAVIEKRFTATPGTPEFLADFYRHELIRLGQRPESSG